MKNNVLESQSEYEREQYPIIRKPIIVFKVADWLEDVFVADRKNKQVWKFDKKDNVDARNENCFYWRAGVSRNLYTAFCKDWFKSVRKKDCTKRLQSMYEKEKHMGMQRRCITYAHELLEMEDNEKSYHLSIIAQYDENGINL